MLTKTIVVAIAGLTLWQGVAGEPSLLQDVLADALNKTQSVAAQNAAQAAAQQLHTIAHNLVISSGSILSNSFGTIQVFADSLGKALSKALGDLPGCITSQQSEALQLFTSAQSDLTRCVTDRVAEVGLLVEDVAGLAAKAMLLPHEAAANMTACLKNPMTAVFCTAEVVGVWGYASEKIVNSIAADVAKGQKLFVTAPHDIATCAAAQVDAAAEGAQRINVSIAQCVVDGSNSSTTPNVAY